MSDTTGQAAGAVAESDHPAATDGAHQCGCAPVRRRWFARARACTFETRQQAPAAEQHGGSGGEDDHTQELLEASGVLQVVPAPASARGAGAAGDRPAS